MGTPMNAREAECMEERQIGEWVGSGWRGKEMWVGPWVDHRL